MAGRRQEALEALACLHVMVVLALLRVEVFPLQTPLLLVAQVVHDLAKQPEPLAARPALLELRALPLLRVGCLGKAAAVAAVVLLALAVRAVLAVAALAAVAAVQHAVHTPLALVVSVVMAGHWYWSSDYGSLCRC